LWSGLGRDSAWSLVAELGGLIGPLVAFTLLGRSLGAEGYGAYASLFALVSPLITLAASGVTLALLQHTVRDGEGLAETARSCLTLALLLGVVLTVVCTGLAQVVVGTLSVLAIVTLLVGEFVIAPMVHIAAATVQVGTGYTGAAQIRLLFVVLRTVVIVVLFLLGELTLEWLGVTTAIVSGALAVGTLHRVGVRYGFALVPGVVRMRHFRTNLTYSTAISASALSNDGDKVVMAANGLVVDTGLYAAAYRVVQLAMLPVGSVVNAAHTRFLQHEEGERGQHLRRAVRFASLSIPYGVVCLVALLLAAPLLPLVVGDEFEESVTMVRWLSPVVLVRALSMFSLNGLMGLGHHAIRSTLIVANAVVAMTIYLVLIPRYGWQGAAIGTLLGETIEIASTWTALVILQRRADRAIEAAERQGGSATSPAEVTVDD
jgi:O-antigen/teichoic acid export membrane protein